MSDCIIGGAGFLGRAVVRNLVARGRRVVVLGRQPQPSALLHPLAHYLRCDVTDGPALSRALQGVTRIVDLSYSTVARATFSDPLADLLANVPMAVGIMQAAQHLPLERYVYVSSGGTVYGEQGPGPLTEDTVPAPVSPYGITKLTAERCALLHHHHYRLPAVIVRPANAYGPEQAAFTGQGFIATAVGTVLARRPVTVFGERGTVRDYIHVDDVASGIVAALGAGIPGAVYNIGTGLGMDNLDILDLIRAEASRSGFELTCEFAPARPADVSANVLDSGALERATGWRPKITCADGIGEVWRTQLARYEE